MVHVYFESSNKEKKRWAFDNYQVKLKSNHPNVSVD